MDETNMSDIVGACAGLVDRAGASSFELGHRDNETTGNVTWYAKAEYADDVVIGVYHYHTPEEAAQALAERLLRGATCRCGAQATTTTPPEQGVWCQWRLVGALWEPSCDATPLEVWGRRGDLGMMRAAMNRRSCG